MLNSSLIKKYYFLLSIPAFLLLLYFSANNYVFSILILSSLVFFFFLFIKIEIGLFLLAFSLPFIEPVFNLGFLEIPIVDLLALFLLSVFIIREIYFYFYSKTVIKQRIVFPLGIYFFTFFLICLLSSFFSENILSAIWYSFRWILFFYLAFVVAPFNIIKNSNLDKSKLLKNILITISVSAFLVFIMGLYSLFLQDWSDSFFRIKPLYLFGFWFFGDNYNLLSEFLVISAFLLLSLKYFYKNTRILKLINLLSLILILTAFFTFGRTAWIVIVLQVVLYFSFYFLLINKPKGKPREVALIFVLFIFLISPFVFKMSSLQEANISSTQNRLLLTDISINAFYNKPLLGYGSGSFVSLVANNIRFVSKYGEPLDSHGFLQKIIAENGLLGLISFLVLLFFIFRKLYFALINNKKDYKLLLPLFIASFGAVFYQFFNTSYYKGRIWLPIALALLALYLVEIKKTKK